MNEQKAIWFKDVINLGFKSSIEADDVFKDMHGYDYRITTLNVNKEISFDWDNENGTVRMLRCDKEATILGDIPIMDLDHLKQMLAFFGMYNTPKITAA